MATERELWARGLLVVLGFFLLMACSPAAEPEAPDATAGRSGVATATPADAGGSGEDQKSDEKEIFSLPSDPSDVMFALGEHQGAYWIDIVTVFDELPCGNLYLVASHRALEPGLVLVEIEGIALRGETCLESVGPAEARILLGSLAPETELRFHYQEAVDRYRLESGPAMLIVEAISTSFTRTGYEHWRQMPFLLYRNPFTGQAEQLPPDALLFYTTTAWAETDGAPFRESVAAVFDELLTLGAQPYQEDGEARGFFYPTPPLDLEGSATHIVRYLRYDGPLAPVEEVLAAHDEIRFAYYLGSSDSSH